MSKSGAVSLRRAMWLLVSSFVLLVAGPALAGGRVEWKTKQMKESDNHSWTIDVAIYMNSTPDVATLPMRFSFNPVVYYERSLLDGKDGPQLRRVPLENKPPLVESVDVGFLDPGNGTIQKRTKFSFKISRGHGFEAGEYDVTIKDGRTDQTLGGVTHITLDGENEVIDRRAISFTGEGKKKEKKDDDADKKEEEPQKKQLTPDDPGFWAGGPKHSDDEKNEEVEPKRGCGCRIGEGSSHGGSAALLGLGVSLALLARRRRAA